MKNTETDNTVVDQEIETTMKDIYEFDYSKAKPNRFAEKFGDDAIMVVLDPDVAAIFQTQEDVNKVLRALIATMPVTHSLMASEAAP